jgi:hypothetical protein
MREHPYMHLDEVRPRYREEFAQTRSLKWAGLARGRAKGAVWLQWQERKFQNANVMEGVEN